MVVTIVSGFAGVVTGAAEDTLIVTTPPVGTEVGAVYAVLTW
jgi:hypothetical protein